MRQVEEEGGAELKSRGINDDGRASDGMSALSSVSLINTLWEEGIGVTVAVSTAIMWDRTSRHSRRHVQY